MERAEKIAKAIGRGLAVFGLGLLLCFAVATIADGLLRYFFASPIDAVSDLGGVIAAVAVASCLPLVLLERGNITIRFVSTFIGVRPGRVADFLASILVEALLIGMGWQFFRYSATEAADGSATWMLHIETAPFWWLVDAMIWAGVAMQAIVIVRYAIGGAPTETHQPVG